MNSLLCLRIFCTEITKCKRYVRNLNLNSINLIEIFLENFTIINNEMYIMYTIIYILILSRKLIDSIYDLGIKTKVCMFHVNIF